MEEPATPVVKLRGESVDNTPADPEVLPALSRPTTAIRKLDSLRRDKITYGLVWWQGFGCDIVVECVA